MTQLTVLPLGSWITAAVLLAVSGAAVDQVAASSAAADQAASSGAATAQSAASGAATAGAEAATPAAAGPASRAPLALVPQTSAPLLLPLQGCHGGHSACATLLRARLRAAFAACFDHTSVSVPVLLQQVHALTTC